MIFISYRHEDGYAARALQTALQTRLAGHVVLRDVTSFTAGDDLRAVISDRIAKARTVLVVLGRVEPGSRSQSVDPRFLNASDWIRFEISLALAWRKDLIPILVNGAPMPTRSTLPRDIAGFGDLLAARLRDADWDDDLRDLIHRIDPDASPGPDRDPRPPRPTIRDAGPVAGGDVVIRGGFVAGRDLTIDE